VLFPKPKVENRKEGMVKTKMVRRDYHLTNNWTQSK